MERGECPDLRNRTVAVETESINQDDILHSFSLISDQHQHQHQQASARFQSSTFNLSDPHHPFRSSPNNFPHTAIKMQFATIIAPFLFAVAMAKPAINAARGGGGGGGGSGGSGTTVTVTVSCLLPISL